MYKVIWDKKTGGVVLTNDCTDDALSVSPRPVFFEELDLLGLDKMGWKYPRCQEPLLWACNKQYYYRGDLVFEAKGANLYDKAEIVFQPGFEKLKLQAVDVKKMLAQSEEILFLIENEAIEFIRDTFQTYSATKLIREKAAANQLDFEALKAKVEKTQKRKMAIVKEDCESFDIVPLEVANAEGKKVLQTTAKIDVFLASFSGGKDSQVVLDLCTRALPPSTFQVIYSDTGYELPPSLKLYEEVKKHYGEKYPGLLFRTARNHESVLNYWDKIGTPSDTHRWCCSIMKTAPLYRMLKIEGTNKQARVLAFEGTRGEESNKRSMYNRIGKGVKHNGVINARPIYHWNTTEVFLYLIKEGLPINLAYRQGKPRVGCVICPFSSEWDDMIVNTCYPKSLKPFVDKIVDFAKSRKIPNLDEYVKGHMWKLRASGKFMAKKRTIAFSQDRSNLKGKADGISMPLETWLPVLGDCFTKRQDDSIVGELKHKDIVYPFEIKYLTESKCEFIFHHLTDIVFAGLVKRALYKATYCINCEACEVECPTGALSVLPKIKIDNKCVHCYKCLTFHNKGCIVADSISMSQTDGLKLTGISGYGTFGMREEWLNEYFLYQDDFWNDNSLGNKQEDSFRNWLVDAGIMDTAAKVKGKVTGKLTELGQYLVSIKDDQPDLVWEIIWINLNHASPLIKWFCTNVKTGSIYSKATLKSIYEQQYEEGFKTFEYSLDAIFNLFATTPIGYDFKQKEEMSKTDSVRAGYSYLSECGVVYSLYKMANALNRDTFRVSELYDGSLNMGAYVEFGVSKQDFEKLLRSLDSYTNRLVKAELNMGLDHITLRPNLDPLDALKQTLNY